MRRLPIILLLLLLLGACKKSHDYPGCIDGMIQSWLRQPKDSRPSSVTEYLYKGEYVYFVVAPCCDMYNPVYNASCDYLGAPSGGITGGGDHKLTGFFTQATNKRLIWGK